MYALLRTVTKLNMLFFYSLKNKDFLYQFEFLFVLINTAFLDLQK